MLMFQKTALIFEGNRQTLTILLHWIYNRNLIIHFKNDTGVVSIIRDLDLKRITYMYIDKNLPVHVKPSPANPVLHLHKNDPTVFVHVAWLWHRVGFKHSSMSTKWERQANWLQLVLLLWNYWIFCHIKFGLLIFLIYFIEWHSGWWK